MADRPTTRRASRFLERETGVEPATLGLGSTAEADPLCLTAFRFGELAPAAVRLLPLAYGLWGYGGGAGRGSCAEPARPPAPGTPAAEVCGLYSRPVGPPAVAGRRTGKLPARSSLSNPGCCGIAELRGPDLSLPASRRPPRPLPGHLNVERSLDAGRRAGPNGSRILAALGKGRAERGLHLRCLIGCSFISRRFRGAGFRLDGRGTS